MQFRFDSVRSSFDNVIGTGPRLTLATILLCSVLLLTQLLRYHLNIDLSTMFFGSSPNRGLSAPRKRTGRENHGNSTLLLLTGVFFVPILSALSFVSRSLLIFTHAHLIGREIMRTAVCSTSAWSSSLYASGTEYYGPGHSHWYLMYATTYNASYWWISSYLFPRLLWSWPISPSIERFVKTHIAKNDERRSNSSTGFVSKRKPRRIQQRQFIRILSRIIYVSHWIYWLLYASIYIPTIYLSFFSSDSLAHTISSSVDCSNYQEWKYDGRPFSWFGLTSDDDGRPMDWVYDSILSVGLIFQVTLSAILVYSSFDPSKEKIAREREKVSKQKNQRLEFIQRFSHVARTSLACVRPYVHQLIAICDGSDDDSGGRDLRMLDVSRRTTEVLVDRLVHFYSLRQDTIQLKPTQCDLVQIVRDVVEAEKVKRLDSIVDVSSANRSPIRSDEIDVSIFSNCKSIVVRIDPTYFHLALTNLISNAIKYSDKGENSEDGIHHSPPRVFVRIERISLTRNSKSADELEGEEEEEEVNGLDTIRIEVRDEGVGMTQKQLNQACGIDSSPSSESSSLEDDFESDDDVEEEEEEEEESIAPPAVLSIGIGLSIVRALSRLFRGRLKFHSPGPGKGTTVCWEIPVEMDTITVDSDQILRNRTVFKTDGFDSLRVVLAEDHPILQKIYTDRMHRLGVREFTVVSDGVELVEYCESHFNELLSKRLVLVVDVNMPRLCGDAATARIRQIDGYANLPIFACTATVRRRSNDDYCQQWGFSGLYEKPLEMEEYAQMLREGLDFYVKKRPSGDSRLKTMREKKDDDEANPPAPGMFKAIASMFVFVAKFMIEFLRNWFGERTNRLSRSEDDEATPVRVVLSTSTSESGLKAAEVPDEVNEEEDRQKIRDRHGIMMRGISSMISLIGFITIIPFPPEGVCLFLHLGSEMFIGPLLAKLFQKVFRVKLDPKEFSLFGLLFWNLLWGILTPHEFNPLHHLLSFTLVHCARLLRGRKLLYAYAFLFAARFLCVMMPLQPILRSSFWRDAALGYVFAGLWWSPTAKIIDSLLFGKVDEAERDHLNQSLQDDRSLTLVQDQIISSSVHDLRNQVGGMSWAVGSILEKASSDARVGKISQQLFSSLSFFSEGCEQLTEYFRLKRNKLVLFQNSGIHLFDFLLRVVEREWSYHRKSAVEFSCDLTGVSPSMLVSCDQLRLRSIVGNLVSNAIKFTSQGSIDVEGSCDLDPNDESVAVLSFRVTDSGRGMSEEKLKEIYLDPFEGGSRLDVDSSLSVGFGIYVQATIAEMMGGSLQHFQNPTDGGVTALFKARFDVCDPLDTLDFCASRVLVVDDSSPIRFMFSRLLAKAGVERIEVAENLAKARTKLVEAEAEGEMFDCAFVDVRLGVRERGSELVETDQIQKRIRRVVLMTGNSIGKWERFVRVHRLYSALQKPVYEEDLLSVVGRRKE